MLPPGLTRHPDAWQGLAGCSVPKDALRKTRQQGAGRMQTAIMACMRNEALFVTEWVAYHRAIGFDHVLVCTNDCDDGTDQILDRLAALGAVTHIRNDDHGATPPQVAGVARVLARPEVQACRWLLHIDADEFLNIRDGAGRLPDWLPRLDAFDATAISWRIFGDSGLAAWPGGLQIARFTRCAGKLGNLSGHQKTMFRPAAFGAGIDHMPKQPKGEVALCNAAGRPLNPAALHHPTASDHRRAHGGIINKQRNFRWQGAQINHYATRTPDLFLLKNFRGDGMRKPFKRYFLNSRWHREANDNSAEDRSIQRHIPAVEGLIAGWHAADPTLAALEASALDRLRHQRATLLTPETVAALTNGTGAKAA
jgi:hypothetical protein